jgi:hypothetical protein
MCVQVTKTANRFEISSLLEKILLVRRKLTIPERWQAVGMHTGGFSHRRVADHFRVNHFIIVPLMQRFRQTGMLLTVHVQVSFAKRRRERTGYCQNGGLRVERAHCHGIFGLSDYHQERTSPTYSQRKNNPRQSTPSTCR